jgi:hypothetical protein
MGLGVSRRLALSTGRSTRLMQLPAKLRYMSKYLLPISVEGVLCHRRHLNICGIANFSTHLYHICLGLSVELASQKVLVAEKTITILRGISWKRYGLSFGISQRTAHGLLTCAQLHFYGYTWVALSSSGWYLRKEKAVFA